METRYPGWPDTKMWLEDTVLTADFALRDITNPFVADPGFTYQNTEYLMERISEKFGAFQDLECRQLKHRLLETEEGDSGRVKLSDFYKTGVQYHSHFKESVQDLRGQGALDESQPGEPRVIVTNYIGSPTNCLAHTGFYSICCVNECEGVLARIETVIAAPAATPQRILEIVQNMSTATVSGGVISESLVHRLVQVATRHGGKIPLHGRLFAQWLHLLFPRECPYPHAPSSNVSPLSASEWMKMRQTVAKPFGVDQMQEYIDRATDDGTRSGNSAEDTLLSTWSEEEEILYEPVVTRRTTGTITAWFFFIGRFVVASVIFAVLASAVANAARKVRHGESGVMSQKAHLV